MSQNRRCEGGGRPPHPRAPLPPLSRNRGAGRSPAGGSNGEARDEAGMVTAEIAFGSLFVAGFLVLVAWVIAVLMAWTACQNVAIEVARQEARGDSRASEHAQRSAPPDAAVSVERDGPLVRVRVSLDARPWADWLPSVPLRASATVTAEGG